MIVATRNPGKTHEFEALLSGILPDIAVTNLSELTQDVPEVVEDGQTFPQNAIKKALETSIYTGRCALSDDSGLEVDALSGAPGVYSARYAERGLEDTVPQDILNNRKLVRALQAVPEDERTARYVAVICLCLAPDDEGTKIAAQLGIPDASDLPTFGEEGELFAVGDRRLIWFRATCEGRIILEPHGEGGFSYDPYFFVEDWGKTMAEVSLAQKNTRSHRALALKKLGAWLTR